MTQTHPLPARFNDELRTLPQRNPLAIAGRLAIGVLILVFVVAKVEDVTSWSDLPRPDFALCIISFLAFGMARVAEAVRLCILVPDRSVPIHRSLKITLVSTFFNNFTTIVVGDGYRAMAVWKSGQNMGAAFVTVFVDRLLGFTAIGFLGSLYLIFCPRSSSPFSVYLPDMNSLHINMLLVIIVSVFLVVVIAGFLWKNVDFAIRSFSRFFEISSRIGKANLFSAFATSLVAQLLVTLMIHSLVLAFGSDLNFVHTLLVMLFVFVASCLPVSVGSLGVREGAMILGFSVFGIPDTAALATALLSRGMIYVYALAGGVLLLFDRHAGAGGKGHGDPRGTVTEDYPETLQQAQFELSDSPTRSNQT